MDVLFAKVIEVLHPYTRFILQLLWPAIKKGESKVVFTEKDLTTFLVKEGGDLAVDPDWVDWQKCLTLIREELAELLDPRPGKRAEVIISKKNGQIELCFDLLPNYPATVVRAKKQFQFRNWIQSFKKKSRGQKCWPQPA